MMLVPLALHFHLFGVASLTQAATDYRYALGSQAAQYFITFGGCLVAFPILWRKPFFEGIHWHGATAFRRSGRLISAAVLCFFVAMINGVLMPGPTNAPIDELFKAPGAAWILFAFGVTLAPFFEEMAFRGFLLPALCTAYDWCVEHFTGAARRPIDEDDNPQWSLSANGCGFSGHQYSLCADARRADQLVAGPVSVADLRQPGPLLGSVSVPIRSPPVPWSTPATTSCSFLLCCSEPADSSTWTRCERQLSALGR